MSVNIKILKQNVLDEAHKQLTENYPGFVQFIAKYTISDVNDDGSSAIGYFILIIAGKKLTIPIIYRDGSVDAMSYIGDDESGRYYALTKTLYNKLINSISNALGTAITKKELNDEQDNNVVDRGIIGSLFATPMTFSPKVASLLSKESSHYIDFDAVKKGFMRAKFKKVGLIKEASNYNDDSMLMDMAYKDKNIAIKLNKLASDNRFSSLLESIGVNKEELDSIINSHILSKIANERSNKPVVYTKIDETKLLPIEKRAEAITKIATQGFYIKNKDTLTKEAETNTEKIKQLVSRTILSSTTDVNSSGIWTMFTKDLKTKTVIVASNADSVQSTYPYSYRESKKINKVFMFDDNVIKSNTSNLIGVKKENHGMGYLDVLNMHLKNKVSDFEHADFLIIANDKEIMYYDTYNLNITKIRNRIIADITIKTNSWNRIIITPNSEINRIIINEGTMYVPESNTFFVKRSEQGFKLNNFMTDMDLESMFFNKTASIHYSDDEIFRYKGSALREKQLVVKLAHEGYTEDSIKKIIKTAKDNKNIETPLMALNQQTAQLVSQVQNQNLTMQQVIMLLGSIKESIDQTNQVLLQQAGALNQTQQGDEQLTQTNEVQDNNTATNTNDMSQQGQSSPEEQIAVLAQQIGQDPSNLIAEAKKQGMSMDDLLLQLQNYVAQQGASAQQQQTQDPTQQQAQDPSQMQAQDPAQQQTQDPSQMQGDDQQQQVQTDENGFMPQNIDPEMLETLKELADKKVLESSIISYLSTIDTPESTVKQYIEELKNGVNGMVRILMIVDSNYKNMLDSVSDSVLSSFLNKGKSLAKKMTDFVLEVESI